MIRLPTVHLTLEQRKAKADEELLKLRNCIYPRFIRSLKTVQYHKSWKIKEYFTALEIATLVYGFNPHSFFCDIDSFKIQNFSCMKLLNKAEEELDNYKHRLYHDELNNLQHFPKEFFAELDLYQQKTIEMQFLFEAILDGLQFDKIRYDKNNNVIKYVRDYKLVKIHKFAIRNFLQSKNIESEFFKTITTNNDNDFYQIPKNHKCITPDAKALIETILHFIEKEPETHNAKSGIKEKISKHIRENNTYKVGETAMKHYIPNILNWTHKK